MAAQRQANPKAENLKILQDLQKKQQLLKKGLEKTGAGDDAAATSLSGPTVTPVVATPQRERIALQHAMQNSNGYFISQDSSFGNLVLPVLPRY